MDKIEPYCPGTDCPLKDRCLHFKPMEQVDKHKEDWWPWAPYQKFRKLCEHFLEDPNWEDDTDKLEPNDCAFCE